jgi:hypothetical protein
MVVAPILFYQSFYDFSQLLMLGFVPQPNLPGFDVAGRAATATIVT